MKGVRKLRIFRFFSGAKNKPRQPKSTGLFSHLDSRYKGPKWNPPTPISLTIKVTPDDWP